MFNDLSSKYFIKTCFTPPGVIREKCVQRHCYRLTKQEWLFAKKRKFFIENDNEMKSFFDAFLVICQWIQGENKLYQVKCIKFHCAIGFSLVWINKTFGKFYKIFINIKYLQFWECKKFLLTECSPKILHNCVKINVLLFF